MIKCFLSCLLFASALVASESVPFTPAHNSTLAKSHATSLDDPQPDSLSYDNGSPAFLLPSANHWVRVRFTSPSEFELRSIYYLGNNPNNRTEVCSVFVYSSVDNAFGEVLSQFNLPGNIVHFPSWGDVNLPTPLTFQEGEEFFVVMGPIVGGLQEQGAHILMDNAATGDRSMAALTGGREGTYTVRDGDFMIRAGGASTPFIDLAGETCFNQLVSTENPAFFMAPGEEVLLKGRIRNRGNVASTPFTISWVVRNDAGATIFQDTRDVPGLAEGGTQTYEAEQLFTPTATGYLLAGFSATGEGDVRNDNDTTWVRLSVGELNQWYRYDDNGTPDRYVGNTPGLRIGTSFAPVAYTAAIETLRVGAGQGTGNGDIRIYLNDADGTPTEEVLWQQVITLAEGWNTIAVNPPVLIYQGQSFTVAHIAVTAGFALDDHGPFASENEAMGSISWTGSGSWQSTLSGNYCLQAYLSESDELPPWPLIALSEDTLQFGAVDTTSTTSVVLDLTISNQGAGDDLVVTGMVISPQAIRSAYTISPTTLTIPAGSSQVVNVTFNPSAIRDYNGLVTISNNSENQPAAVVLIRGSGVLGTDAEPSSALPDAFSLAQAYPNPFNPATMLTYHLPQSANVLLTVYDVAGREVATLVERKQAAGSYNVAFDGARLASGIYYARLNAGEFQATQKLVLLK